MAFTALRYCLLMTAVVIALTVDGRAFAAPWAAPFNTFAHAAIHSHHWRPPPMMGQGAQRPSTTVLPVHPSPYPLFHTLPYPLPHPLLCPRFGYPPYAVDQHGRLPPQALYQTQALYRTQTQALYQNTFSRGPLAGPTPFEPLPFYPTPFTFFCRPFPLPFPLPYTGAPLPQ